MKNEDNFDETRLRDDVPESRQEVGWEAAFQERINVARNLDEFLNAISSVDVVNSKSGKPTLTIDMVNTIERIAYDRPERPEAISRAILSTILTFGGVTSSFDIRPKAIEFIFAQWGVVPSEE